jgi:hypothetical protein
MIAVDISEAFVLSDRLFHSATFLPIIHRHPEELGIHIDRSSFKVTLSTTSTRCIGCHRGDSIFVDELGKWFSQSDRLD